MNSAVRHITWSQGNIIPEAGAKELALTERDDQYAIVITHDCDLAAELDKEPNCEIIVAQRIERLGANSYAKSARHLDLDFQTHDGTLVLQLIATHKRQLAKAELFRYEPCQAMALSRESRVTLKRWLAARYDRATFPEAFEQHLKTTKDKIAKCLAKQGDHIRALYFDSDDGETIERTVEDGPYQLRIVVLYNSSLNEKIAYKAAVAVTTELEELFTKTYASEQGVWTGIQLLSVDAMSDQAMTVAQRSLLSEWRLDHLSLRADPQHQIAYI